MLSPLEFTCGYAGDATGLSLVMSRGRYEHPLLVTAATGTLTAIILDGQHQFATFECTNNNAWKGMIIPNIAIELDEASVFDAEGLYPPLGTMVRKNDSLAMAAMADRSFRTVALAPVLKGLPMCRDNLAAGFTRWQIVLGEGIGKRVLKTIETTQKPSD